MWYIFWQPMANKKKRKLTWEISVPWFNHQLRVQNVWTRFEIEGAFGDDAPSSQILCGKFEESKTKAPLWAWRLSLCRLGRLFQPGNRRALANENKRNPSMPCLLKSELSNQSQISQMYPKTWSISNDDLYSWDCLFCLHHSCGFGGLPFTNQLRKEHCIMSCTFYTFHFVQV